jgi:hypothetical protein
MLQKLSDHIAACLARARAADERADAVTDPEVRNEHQQLARSWRALAQSYQFVESLERFLLDRDIRKAELAPAMPEVIERPCPQCAGIMRLMRVEPDAPDHDRRWFECGQCGYEDNIVVKFR